MVSSELLGLPATYPLQSPSFEKEYRAGGHGRLSMVSINQHRATRCPMDSLSAEILNLVFLQLRDIDSKSLATCRRASKRINAIITPLKYETLRLTERIIATQAEIYLPHSLQNVYKHTRHVEVHSKLNPEGIQRVLAKIQRLLSVRWRYATPSLRSGPFWIPSQVLSPAHQLSDGVRLLVENLPLEDFTDRDRDAYLSAIPARLLVSLKAESHYPLHTPQLRSLKQLLLKASRLETFHYNDKGQGTNFTFAAGERLPAFRELVLKSYNWNHNAGDVRDHWDFSRTRRLRLFDVPLFPFLTSVPPLHLRNLDVLECEDFSPYAPELRLAATTGLYELVRQIHRLETLKIHCHTENFPIDALLKHSNSLRHLIFRDYTGFGEDSRSCPTMSLHDLVRLSRSLTHLRSLEIDMDITAIQVDPARFLGVIGRFPAVADLTLHVQTVVDPLQSDIDLNVDQDYQAALSMFRALFRAKQQLEEESESLVRFGGPAPPRSVPWRSITINVGGWRRVMSRRLSEPWKEMNLQGVYAERCFVLEKQPAENGAGYSISEEVSIEPEPNTMDIDD